MIWVQGCSLGCPGCFNPETHNPAGGSQISVTELVAKLRSLERSIEGITLSGGEPFQQKPAVTELLKAIKQQTQLSTIVLSGFTWEEICRMDAARTRELPTEQPAFAGFGSDQAEPSRPKRSWPEVLNYVDVLIAGRYEPSRRAASALRGSSNKTVHLLSGRYTLADLAAVPPAEVIIAEDGETLLSGIEPVRF